MFILTEDDHGPLAINVAHIVRIYPVDDKPNKVYIKTVDEQVVTEYRVSYECLCKMLDAKPITNIERHSNEIPIRRDLP